MVAFKNFLGGIMYVDESRVDEYLSNGYIRIAEEAHTKSEDKATEEITVPEEVAEETTVTEKPKRSNKKKK